jgi:hypothetical protein
MDPLCRFVSYTPLATVPFGLVLPLPHFSTRPPPQLSVCPAPLPASIPTPSFSSPLKPLSPAHHAPPSPPSPSQPPSPKPSICSHPPPNPYPHSRFQTIVLIKESLIGPHPGIRPLPIYHSNVEEPTCCKMEEVKHKLQQQQQKQWDY